MSIFDHQLVEKKEYDKQEITKNNYFDCSGNGNVGSHISTQMQNICLEFKEKNLQMSKHSAQCSFYLDFGKSSES